MEPELRVKMDSLFMGSNQFNRRREGAGLCSSPLCIEYHESKLWAEYHESELVVESLCRRVGCSGFGLNSAAFLGITAVLGIGVGCRGLLCEASPAGVIGAVCEGHAADTRPAVGTTALWTMGDLGDGT